MVQRRAVESGRERGGLAAKIIAAFTLTVGVVVFQAAEESPPAAAASGAPAVAAKAVPGGFRPLDLPGQGQQQFECIAGGPGILSQYANGAGESSLYDVDIVSGDYPEPATFTVAGHRVNALGYNALDDYLYGWSNNGDQSQMVRIGADEVVTELGNPVGAPAATDVAIGDIDENGHYWYVVGDLPGVAWYEVDLVPGSPTYMEVLNSGDPLAGGGINNPDDRGFADWAYVPGAGNYLYTVVTISGEATFLYRFDRETHLMENLGDPGIGDPQGFGAMYADAGGYLYGSQNADGDIYRFDVAAGTGEWFASGPSKTNNDGARCPLALSVDFGDAPGSYGSTLETDGARHGIPGFDEATGTAPLMLGATIDPETDGLPGAAADGDGADDDGVTAPIAQIDGAPTTVGVSATNNTTADATLAGWIDLDGNGTFDPAELVTATVPADSGTASYDLAFPPATTSAGTYARFRLYPGVVAADDILPTGPASAGEVEDYPVTAPGLQPFECTADGILIQHVAPRSEPTTATAVDLVTGKYGEFFPDITDRAINAVGYNVLDNYIYGIDLSDAPASQSVVRIGAVGLTEALGPVDGFDNSGGITIVGDVDDQGHYWAVQTGTGHWYEIDLAPGSATYMQILNDGTIGTWPTSADWAFVPGTNALYSVGNVDDVNHLFAFDRTTHAFTDLGDLGTGAAIASGAMYAAPGQLYTSNNTGGAIYRIDVATVTGELFTTGPASTGNDGARCPIPVWVDFGDAPAGYGTLLADDGARHGIPGYDEGTGTAPVMLGASIDAETDAVPTELADGDDTAEGDDEDGVIFNADLGYPNPTLQTGFDPVSLQPMENTLDVAASADGFVSVWVDWNLNGTFDGDEQVIAAQAVSAGDNALTFTQEANPTDIETYVRVRYSTDAAFVAESVGPAPDGEVEDYRVFVERFLTPDACVASSAPHYSFTFDTIVDVSGDGTAGSAARYPNVSVIDGVPVDMLVEVTDGQLNNTVGAGNGFTATGVGAGSVLGPQTAGWFVTTTATIQYTFVQAGTTTPIAVSAAFTVNDLDGPPTTQETMTFSTADLASYAVTQGSAVQIVETGGTVEFRGDGDWDGDPESRFQVVLEEVSSFEVVSTGGNTTGLGFNGNGALGVQPAACDDFGDAPASYGTTLADDGPRHTIVSGLYLGEQIDFDADGQPSDAADADDTTRLADEDGVADPIALVTGEDTTVSVNVTNTTGEPATLAGWIDLDGNGTFDSGELVTATVPAGSGTASYDLTFPEATVFTDTYARFRLFPGDVADPQPTGPAAAGEVEDYPVAAPPQPPFECVAGGPGLLFQNQPADVFGVNLITGERAEIASDISPDFNATGYNPLDNYIYAFSNSDGGIWRVGEGFTTAPLGLPDNWTTFPGMPAALADLETRPYVGEFDADGHYWVAVPRNDTALDWAEIDLDPSSATYFEVVAAGTTQATGIQRLPWDWSYNVDDGNLYGIARAGGLNRAVIRFDTTTHTVEIVQQLGELIHPNGNTSVTFGASYADADGFMYSSDNTTGGIWRTDMTTGDTEFFSAGPISNTNDGARCFLAGLPIDFGDAPNSYGTRLGADGARHGILGYDEVTNTAPLMLGATVDPETDGLPGAAADGDDLDGLDDENGIPEPVQMAPGAPLALTVTATNDTDEDATLAGWLDLNGNGTFNAAERVTVIVPAGSGTADYALTFPAATTADDTYLRLRLFPGSTDPDDILPTGPASAGEVEDYPVMVQFADVSIDKTAGVPVSLDNGQYQVDYTLTVANAGNAPDIYTLTDELQYGDGVTVVSTSVTNDAPGTIAVNPAFDGEADPQIAAGVPIDAATPTGATEHTYTVSVVFTVDPGITPGAADCTTDPGETGTGLLNTATVSATSGDDTDDGCAPVPVTRFTKELTGVSSNGDGTYTLDYELTVEREGIDGTYTLADELQLTDAATVDTVTLTNTAPGDVTVDPAFDGVANTTIATDVPIAAGDTHTYGMTLVVDVDVAAVTPTNSDCTIDPGEGGSGASNTATLTVDGQDIEGDACEPFPGITIDKAITTGPTPAGGGTYTITYELTVTNNGAAGDSYDLTDELQYGDGVTVSTAEVTGTEPGGLPVNAAWDGVTDTTVAAGVPIDGAVDGVPAVHLYTVTVTAAAPAGMEPAAADCTLIPGEAGTGFFNTATLTSGIGEATDDACEPVPSTTFAKELATVAPNGDGTYTLTYELTVTRTGDGAPYDLTDELQYGDAVTPNSVEVTTTDPTDIVTNDGFDGVGDTTIATGVAIADGETHTYTITVVAAVDGGAITFDNTDCDLAAGENGTGFFNSATLTTNGSTIDDTACEPVPGAPAIDKAITGVAPAGDGTYRVTYDITVTNTAAGAATYDLADELQYGDGITVDLASVTAAPDGVTTNPAWDGLDVTDIVTDQEIAGGAAGAPTTHVYTVTVYASVPAGLPAEAADCDPATGDANTGFLNTATLTNNGVDSPADACEPAPTTTIDKELTNVEPHGDGTYTLTYALTVTRTGTGADYELRDELQYGAGVTVDSAVGSGVSPAGLATNPAFDGTTDTLLAGPTAIADGETHVYQVVVNATVTAADVTFESSACDAADGGPGSGFFNTATLTTNDVDITDDACEPIPAITVDKTVSSGPTEGVGPAGESQIEYTLTVTNRGAGDGTYDLADQLTFGAGITVVSAEAANTDPGTIVPNPAFDGLGDTSIVTGQEILGAADAATPTVHTYTVTVLFTVDAAITDEAADCTLDQGENGTGLRNETTLNGTSGPDSAEDCVPPPVTRFAKDLVDINSLGGNQFELVYELTAERVSGGDTTYTLTDDLRPGASTTVDGVTVTTDPADIALNGAFDGQADTTVATDVPIATGATHVYTITVTVTVVPADVTPQNSDCNLDQGEDGTGALNQATLTTPGTTIDAEACRPFPGITITKEITSGPNPLGDDQYGLSYLITVMNNGSGEGTYDLDDTLAYGGEAEIVSSAVTGVDPSTIVPSPTWNGTTDTRIVSGQAIEGATAEPVIHTYTVDVVARVPGVAPADAACAVGPAPDGGFANQATITVEGDTQDAVACEPIPTTTITKTIAAVTPNGDGTSTVDYDITVSRSGDGGPYTLTDTFEFGSPVTVRAVDVSNTTPGGITTDPAFDGAAAPTIAADVAIADGESHVYRVSVVVEVDEAAITPANSDCDAADGSGSGLANTATVESNGSSGSATACEPVAGIVIAKSITGAPAPMDGNRYRIDYEVAVTNQGAGAGSYDLADRFHFGAGVSVASVNVGNSAPGGIPIDAAFDGQGHATIATGVDIAGGAAHTYTVSVVVTVAGSITTEARDCTLGGGESGTGFLNEATVDVDGETKQATACDEVPGAHRLRIEKQVDKTSAALGDVVTYTVTVKNIGDLDYTADHPAQAVDSLTDVLDDATWLDNAKASAGALAFASPKLTWTGPLKVGASVTITYGVKVTPTITGNGRLANTAGTTNDESNCPLSGTLGPECDTQTNLVVPPPPGSTPPPTIPDPNLPATGGSPMPTLWLAAGFLLAGVTLVVSLRRRRSRT